MFSVKIFSERVHLSNQDGVAFSLAQSTIFRGTQQCWRRVTLGPLELRLTSALIVGSVNGHSFQLNEMIDVLWIDCKEGGPDLADRAVYALLHRLRKKLQPLALRIARNSGYRHYIAVDPLWISKVAA